jgi:energy-coupling factor transport system permease protein
MKTWSPTAAIHPLAWLAWLTAAALPAFTTRNPLYLSLVLLAAATVYKALGRRSPLARSWGAFVRFGALLWLLTIPFTLLTAHHGTLVLLRLPSHWPVIGGPLTGEALLYGLTAGLSLITLLLVFAVFNVAVDQARLLRLTPGFMYQAGVITAIAVAFVPQMVAAWEAIREAQEVRGHRVRGIRDLLPLLVPLLVTALERAVQLAESMEARGFGGQVWDANPRSPRAGQVVMLAGLAALGAGCALSGFWPERQALNVALLATGAAGLLWAFWDLGRRVRRSRYHRWTWNRADRLILAASLIAALGWVIAWLFQGDWLFYYPYPPYSPWPTFQPALGVLILLLAAPGLLLQP